MSRRGFTIIDHIKLMSARGKITLVVLAITLVSFVCAFSYMSLAKEVEETQVQEVDVKNEVKKENVVKVDPSSITFLNEIEEENTVDENEVEEENTVEKEVTYKGKKVTVPKAEVAPANSAEDAQKQKTGGEAISAEEAVNKFENDGQSAGIDVSAHQGRIDWAQVKASGIEFAMIRVGFRGYTEGGIYEDAYFKSNINGAVKNGIMVGVYFYSVAKNEEEAIQEAAWLVERIKSYRITYPVVYDFEDFTRGRTAGISGAQATANAKAFLNYVASKGYTPMMYANKNDISTRFDKGSLGYKFWLAHYTSSTDYTGSYQMWQYTSSGSVPGISGRVDMNVAYFRYGAVAEPKHTHDFNGGKEIANKTKKPTCTEDGEMYIRCKDCSENERRVLKATGHNYKKVDAEYKAPTCMETGKEVTRCENCNDTKIKEIPKIAHDYKNGITLENAPGNKPASCTEKGIKVVKCKNCETTSKVEIDKLSHNYEGMTPTIVEATCTQKGSKTTKCKNCDYEKVEEIPEKEHTYGEGVVTTPATPTSEGVKTFTCTLCGTSKTEKIPVDQQTTGTDTSGGNVDTTGGDTAGSSGGEQSTEEPSGDTANAIQ